ncbi:hypothetical protein DH2020_045208 [Rehmannia glutinosa]|uniref:R2R3-MYB protein n=1 Tax=Rehmannia glutinosa TaxID=99300 RepID=A0ABR0UEU4_REHGL
MGRHSCCYKQKLRKGLWSPEEDEKLIKHITIYGHGCWSSVPKLAGLQRCGKSCRLRWINYLRPDLKRGTFSLEEQNLIIELHANPNHGLNHMHNHGLSTNPDSDLFSKSSELMVSDNHFNDNALLHSMPSPNLSVSARIKPENFPSDFPITLFGVNGISTSNVSSSSDDLQITNCNFLANNNNSLPEDIKWTDYQFLIGNNIYNQTADWNPINQQQQHLLQDFQRLFG